MLEFKPDFEESAKRWEAFWAGEILDRPLCAIRAVKEGVTPVPGPAYMEGRYGDFEPLIEKAVEWSSTIFWGGDAMPVFNPSFGPDEIGAFCGAELQWHPDSPGTSWSVPFVEDWQQALPLKLDPENKWWRRMRELVSAASRAMDGKMFITMLDLHTNMDLLAAIRGPERLCCDLLDMPEIIDRAMDSARSLFAPIYDGFFQAANQGPLGTMSGPFYHPRLAGLLQCDFSCMMSPQTFRRWVLPALEEEVAHVDGSCYHWDGPDALKHLPDLLSIRKLRVIQWVPGAGQPGLESYIALFKQIQSAGKAIHLYCAPQAIPFFHEQLRPEHVFYDCWAPSEKEARETLEWLVKHT